MIMLNFSILSRFTVCSYCDVTGGVLSFDDNFMDLMSTLGHLVCDTTHGMVDDFFEFIGVGSGTNDRGNYIGQHYIINETPAGGRGEVEVDDTLKNDLTRFANHIKDNNTDFTYCYSVGIDYIGATFGNKQRFESVKNYLLQNNDKFNVIESGYVLSSSISDSQDRLSLADGGARSFIIFTFNDVQSLVRSGGGNFGSGYRYQVDIYNENWDRLRYGNVSQTAVFSARGDLELTVMPISDSRPNQDLNAYFAGTRTFSFPYVNSYESLYRYAISKNVIQYPMYSSVDIMKNYSLGNLPYYVAPDNNVWTYNTTTNTYTTTQTQLDSSLSYGDIQNYVNSNNVTDYNQVYNYINNYYSSGGGSGGSGGGSGGSGSDVDWSWLGSIGEVIGGLISGLGNIIAGIISAIGSIITNLTETLPNIFGSLINYLLPFLPTEITSLLSLLFLAVVIVGVVRLIRGK